MDWAQLGLLAGSAVGGAFLTFVGFKLVGKPPAPKSTWDGIDADIDKRRKK